jgi:hypothetical protein
VSFGRDVSTDSTVAPGPAVMALPVSDSLPSAYVLTLIDVCPGSGVEMFATA